VKTAKNKDEANKPRGRRGEGSVYLYRRTWWIAYKGADGTRIKESAHSDRKGDATTLLKKRNGSREHNLPIVKNAERLTFNDAAQAVEDDFTTNNKVSLNVLQGRLKVHLTPYFGGRRLVAITAADVVAYVAHRQKEGIVRHKGKRKGERLRDVSNAEINRELQTLKRIFRLAMEQGRIASRPHIKLLKESAPRSGFFEPAQFEAVVRHLPVEIKPVIRFAYHTGWRIASEVLPLEWRQVDFAAGEVRLDAGTTKNGEGRVVHMSRALRTVLEGQRDEHERLKQAGHICPSVFFREVADGRGGEKSPQPIVNLTKAWRLACRLAGCPGRIPHDLRRTAVRNFVRAGIPERVAMMMTGHKTASVFARYNIVSSSDLKDAAQKMDIASGQRS